MTKSNAFVADVEELLDEEKSSSGLILAIIGVQNSKNYLKRSPYMKFEAVISSLLAETDK